MWKRAEAGFFLSQILGRNECRLLNDRNEELKSVLVAGLVNIVDHFTDLALQRSVSL